MASTNPMSFLPDDYLARKWQRRTNVICAGLFLIVMIVLVAAFAITERPLRLARRINADVARQYAEAAKPIEQFRLLQEKERQVSGQADLTASLLEKVPRTLLLAQITNALPPGTSLLEISLDSKAHPLPTGPARTQYDIKKAALDAKNAAATVEKTPVAMDVSMRVTGMAATDVQVAQFMNNLSKSKLFNDVNLVISDEFEHQKEKVRKFQVEMSVAEDNADDTASVGVNPEAR